MRQNDSLQYIYLFIHKRRYNICTRSTDYQNVNIVCYDNVKSYYEPAKITFRDIQRKMAATARQDCETADYSLSSAVNHPLSSLGDSFRRKIINRKHLRECIQRVAV